jgi:tripartite-type tricarboxylate transporter receptor subunit TctC
MRITRRQLLRSVAAFAPAGPLAASATDDAPFPTRPVRIMVASAPGTSVDQVTRLYAERMSAFLHQPMVVDNVTGASTAIAARQLARAVPDGYTLMTSANTVVVAPLVIRSAGYDLSDFSAVGELARSPALLTVSGSSPYRNLAELLAAAKARPGALSYGSSGVGATNHLPVEMFARQAGVSFTHVPYKGISLAVPDVVANRVTFMLAAPTSVQQLLKSGVLRALAISSETRSATFPDVPTFEELGYGAGSYAVWIGMLGPANLPPAVHARLAQALESARGDRELGRRLEAAGQGISQVRTPEQFAALLRAEQDRLRKVIKDASIGLE